MIKNVKDFFQSSLVLFIVAMMLLFIEFNLPVFYFKFFGHSYDSRRFTNMLYFVGFTFICFFLIPVLINRFIYQKKLKDVGLIIPKNKLKVIVLSMLAMMAFVPLMVYLGEKKQFQIYYSLHHAETIKVIFLITFILPIYYFCEEFFIRGFMLLNLWDKVKWHSIWITDVVFTLAHIFKPWLEVLAAIPVGIVLGFLTLMTRSIFPTMVVHYAMGITMIVTANHYF